jgi:predicted dehydrogenase/nucleoside-diphosphate-sugar epimerase
VNRTGSSSVRVGILGTGYIADWHLKALARLGKIKVVAVADLDRRRAEAMAAAHGVAECYTSLEAMLAEAKLDVLHVLTPPQTHFAAADAALDAGVNVLVEKPMCVDPGECAALAEKAQAKGLHVGVNHNFLFTAEYERLRAAIAAGALGRIDHVSIVWNKPLGQLAAGPFDIWMLRSPENIILEIGPHLAAHLLDLAGPVDSLHVETSNTIELPSGQPFHRRWRIATEHGKAAGDLLVSFNPGFAEHYIHVRGSHGSARVDFENQTFTLDRPTRYGIDFDRLVRVRTIGGGLRRQAGRNFWQYILSKLKLSDRGNSFGWSIQSSLRAFYDTLAGSKDDRMTAKLGVDVVELCTQIAAQVAPAAAPKPALPTYVNGTSGHPRATVLVLGGTGFIGKELVRQLVEQHYAVRVLTRSSANPGGVFTHPAVRLVKGSMNRRESLAEALQGVDYVFHLARAHVKRWEDYYNEDVLGTKLVAEACLAAGVKRLIYTGTIDSYYAGRKAAVIREESGLDPYIHRRNYYARAKCEAEALLLAMNAEQRLPVVILRPGIVLGPGGSPFHWGVGMWNSNAVCQLWGDGDNPLPIVLVSDVATGLLAAIDTPDIEGESFNLVGDPCLTGREYIAELERSLGVKLDTLRTPIWKFYMTDMAKWCVKCVVRHPDRKLPSYRDWESRTQRARFDCTKAKQRLNWSPTTDRRRVIREGIEQPSAELAL